MTSSQKAALNLVRFKFLITGPKQQKIRIEADLMKTATRAKSLRKWIFFFLTRS